MADFMNQRRYENLKRLSTEQLEELLRTAPFIADSQETSEYYDAIEEVILQRETETPTGRLSDLDSSWKEFQQQYATPEGHGLRLYPDEEGSEREISQTEFKRFNNNNILRRAILIAATITVVFACMVAVQAAGVDVFGSLARWTEETFHFNGGGKTLVGETAHPQIEDETYLAIQAEVDKLDIDILVVPTWFPDGYELEEIRLPNPDITAWQDIDCRFRDQDGQTFFLTIAKYVEKYDISSIVFEKDGQPVSQYISNDKLFYLMSNNSRKRGVWSNGYIVLSIDGSLSEETIKTIIDSIGGEESRNVGGGKTPVGETERPQIEDETYLAIQAEVDKLDIDIPVVPTWFPEGYELQEVKPSNPNIMDWQSIDCAFLNDDDEYVFLTITKYVEGHDFSRAAFEKDDRPVIKYLGGNKLFYIMSNNSRKTAAWSDGQIVVSIDGPLTEETLKTMIDSIGG